MASFTKLDKVSINTRSHYLLRKLLSENPKLNTIMVNSKNETEALVGVKNMVLDMVQDKREVIEYYEEKNIGKEAFEKLTWSDYAAIRILDYIKHAGKEFKDLNLRGKIAVSNPIKMLWLATNYGTGGARPDFFEDMIELFNQLSERTHHEHPGRQQVVDWMNNFPSGLDQRIIKLREENRHRIINLFIDKMESGKLKKNKYKFPEGATREEKFKLMETWWNDMAFHIAFAIRTPEELNEILGGSLDPDTMTVLKKAEKKGIPFFVNPYYLSLINVRVPYFAVGSDLAIRHYIFYSKQLVKEFGHIVAWEKEDQVEPGKPNHAGWVLPSHRCIHRRYPDVAILIPETTGRACGGLCTSCQRMFDFQRGHLNFDLKKLAPEKTWPERLKMLMEYFENDSQLKDILITGGDALMSSDRHLEHILKDTLQMIHNKRENNNNKPNGEKFAEMLRVRIGTRLPVYLPQRVTPELVKILSSFKKEAAKMGVRQFVIQTHFESPLEITPEAKEAIQLLSQSGWIVTNQTVFIMSSSRRGHTAKLRQELNSIGVLPYYTFTVKGYMENYYNFAPNARSVQESIEEKVFGVIPDNLLDKLEALPDDPENIVGNIDEIRKDANLPFLATDKNVLNLPGVGKSLTFRTIGITRYGRRILEFDHDPTRPHSPIIEKMGKVYIIESKSITEYLQQLKDVGEDPEEYTSIYGYSMGFSEKRLPLYNYPEFDFKVTEELTNYQGD